VRLEELCLNGITMIKVTCFSTVGCNREGRVVLIAFSVDNVSAIRIFSYMASISCELHMFCDILNFARRERRCSVAIVIV
jgi:hypothetical protein